jgi:thimet oligopeptidase
MQIYRMLLVVLAIVVLVLTFMRLQPRVHYDIANIQSVSDLVAVFPHNVGYLERATDAYMTEARELIAQIKSIPDHERTFENTVKALDYLFGLSDIVLFSSVLSTITHLYPQADMRDAATMQQSRINAFMVDISADKQLYQAVKAYTLDGAQKEDLNDEQRYVLDTMMRDFKRSGLELPDAQLEQVKALSKEITDLGKLFDKNLGEDKSFITVDAAGLDGVSPEFVASLKKDAEGNYILGVDYPTIAQVMEHATSSDTRKRLYLAFDNRAYPANEEVLKQIAAKRHELAQLLGFSSYAAYDLDNQMVKSVEHATKFIDNLIGRAGIKEAQEFKELITDLPAGVTLSPDGKMYPWDIGYSRAYIKKKKYSIDERVVAEYFPVEHALQGMLNLYATFLSLRFDTEQINGLWVDDLTLLTVYKKGTETKPIGYAILDLYPRPDKFSHAACQPFIPATYQEDGTPTIAVDILMANFPKAQGDQPALFKRSDVTTFFHEFGHVLHAMLGRTQMASVSGLRVKSDFVEMPSQMLEEWMSDSATLKQLSHHYKTGQQLPDDIVASIKALKHFSTGYWAQRQASLATFALQLFGAEQIDDIHKLWESVAKRIISNSVFMPEGHFYTSFGHLANSGYGPKYYGYMWSKVFALDLFGEIKRHGLQNPEVGARYTEKVIGRGGSADPVELLTDFLGRAPSDEAFFKDMGI